MSAQSSAKTLPELLKLIRASPGKITYGATGSGSQHQLATLVLAQLSGGLPGMTEVQYKGSTSAHPDIIANRITFMIDPLAAASPQRNPSFPDALAVAEVLPGYDFASWGGMFAPARPPRAVVLKLNAAIELALAIPDIVKRFNDMGLVLRHSTPEAFGQFLQSEINRWRALLKKP